MSDKHRIAPEGSKPCSVDYYMQQVRIEQTAANAAIRNLNNAIDRLAGRLNDR